MILDEENASKLIKYARNNILEYLEKAKPLAIPDDLKENYTEKRGVFVTLNTYSGTPSEGDLRGCIGIILPMYPLIEAIQQMSIAAATEDPRFPQVKKAEMDHIIIEISVLSVPEVLKVKSPEEYKEHIKIGRDGLIITRGGRRGLLLPQVPVDHDRNWDVETFLDHTCQKAWLPPAAWADVKNTQVEKFSATIFEELSPGGEIREKFLI